jgi:hypothetical protein
MGPRFAFGSGWRAEILGVMLGTFLDVPHLALADSGPMITNLTTEARVLLAEFAALSGVLATVGLTGISG